MGENSDNTRRNLSRTSFQNFLHSSFFVDSAFIPEYIQRKFMMKNSLSLPLPSYRSPETLPYLIVDPELPVEGAVQQEPEAVIVFDSVERHTNGQIDQATLNAERNRKVSDDLCSLTIINDTAANLKNTRNRGQSVSFGTESEVEYCADETPKLARMTERILKDFDGNRSGRPSAKS